ncbi:hypothetical protein B0J14DRAFT_649046 [Halenospora varia]|nr:hypothetical protein B0J14DRAFT_649046 [Halenospora varia]
MSKEKDHSKGSSALPSQPKALSKNEEENKEWLQRCLDMLPNGECSEDNGEIKATPIFTQTVLDQPRSHLSQYGFLGGISSQLRTSKNGGCERSKPSSCLPKCCPSGKSINQVENPLAGLVFHYDPFGGDRVGTPCEAAYLASTGEINIRVICAPENIETIKVKKYPFLISRTYACIANVDVEPLHIDESDLTTGRMMKLTAVDENDGSMPLYFHSIFKELVLVESMTPAQLSPLTMRLDSLESVLPPGQTGIKGLLKNTPKEPSKEPKNSSKEESKTKPKKSQHNSQQAAQQEPPQKKSESVKGVDWSLKSIYAGGDTLYLFLRNKENEDAAEQSNSPMIEPTVGRVVALDEAHKYVNTSAEASALTEALLGVIRYQRHVGTRAITSTQEPTISTALLDLCSITIIHRFTSPNWLHRLRAHLAALDYHDSSTGDEDNEGKSKANKIFKEIVNLRVGEALMFAPSAVVGIEAPKTEEGKKIKKGPGEIVKLGVGYLKVIKMTES